MLFVSLPNNNSGISELDQEESVWQINWVHAHEPASQHEIYNKKCNRHWFPITFRDATMQRTLWIQNKAAMQLAGCETAADFIEKHAAGKLWFPLLCSLKIVKKRNAVKTEDPEGAGGYATDHCDAIIAEASEQDLSKHPPLHRWC